MPKVSEGYRAARRGEIADAVLRRMERFGYSGLSMADIFAEAGLSAGSVYSHFRSKSEIAVFVVQRLHEGLIRDVRSWSDDRVGAGDLIDPPALTRWMLQRLSARRGSGAPLLQLWAEASVQDAFRIALRRNSAMLRREVIAILEPWARTEYPGDEAAARAAARRASRGSLVLCAGFISQSIVYGESDIDEYLATMRDVIGA